MRSDTQKSAQVITLYTAEQRITMALTRAKQRRYDALHAAIEAEKKRHDRSWIAFDWTNEELGAF